jgi:hypothetical protein
MFILLDSRKNCSSSKDLSAHKIAWSHVDWCKFCVHLSGLKIPPSPHSQDPLKKIIIQVQLVGVSIIYHCTKLRLPKCNGSWVVAIKQKLILNINRPPCSNLFVFRKSGLIKNCSSSKDLSAHIIAWSHVDWCKFCIHFSSLKIPPSPHSQDPFKKIIIQVQLVGVSIIYHCTKLRLPKCNGSWVVTMKQKLI